MSRDGLGAFLTVLDVSAFLLQSLGLETVVDFVGLAIRLSKCPFSRYLALYARSG